MATEPRAPPPSFVIRSRVMKMLAINTLGTAFGIVVGRLMWLALFGEIR